MTAGILKSQSNQDELHRLVNDFCNGILAEEGCRRLDGLLESDDSARQYYNNFMFLHAALYADHASLSHVDVESAEASDERESSLPRLARTRAPLRSSWITLAATLLGVAAVSSWLTYKVTQSRLASRSAGSIASAGSATRRSGR